MNPCISRLQYIHNPLSMSRTQMEGFEPSGRLPGQLLSGEPHSATLPHLPEQCIRTSGPDSQIHACAGLDLNQQCLPPGSRFYRPQNTTVLCGFQAQCCISCCIFPKMVYYIEASELNSGAFILNQNPLCTRFPAPHFPDYASRPPPADHLMLGRNSTSHLSRPLGRTHCHSSGAS